MASPADHAISRLVREIQAGRTGASEELLGLVYEDLRRLARGQKDGQSVAPTSLVHQAWVRLGGAVAPGWENRRHFFFAAGRAMRQLLVERARRTSRQRRTAPLPEDLEDPAVLIASPDADLAGLDEAVERLDPEQRRLVELRFFAGLSMSEVAEAMSLPLRTLEREWRYVKARLHQELTERGHGRKDRRDDG